jgi:hypothetical protein
MRKAQNIFSRKASRIVRVLLVHPQEGWTIKDLSKEAGVSIGFTHAVVMSLIDQRHVYRDESYRLRVSDPVKLIQRWAAYHNYIAMNTFLHYHTFEKNIEAFLSNMKEANDLEYALTVLAGAHIVAPYVRPTTIHFYIKEKKKAKTWVELLDLRPVETGGNVSIVLPYDEGVFYGVSQVAGVNVVSKVQLYVDLFNYPARGEEAAEIILRILEKRWAPRKG